MGHKEAVQRMGLIHMEKFGQPLLFTPSGGSPLPIRAILIDDGVDAAGATRARTGTLKILKEEAPELHYQDTVTTEAGEVWSLIKDEGCNDGFWKWSLRQDLRSTLKRG